jgi:hypothetical protein
MSAISPSLSVVNIGHSGEYAQHAPHALHGPTAA